MDPDDINALPGQLQAQCGCRRITFDFFISQNATNETFTGMANQDRRGQFIKPPGPVQQRQIVLMRFAKTDSRVQANSFGRYPGVNQVVKSPRQVGTDLADHVRILRGILHGLHRSLHMHYAKTCFAAQGDI